MFTDFFAFNLVIFSIINGSGGVGFFERFKGES